MTPFPPELRTMSFVSRWNIMWRIRDSNIAEHSFYVAWYAFMIAKMIKWQGNLAYTVLKALEHDLDETITADICGPARAVILDKEKAALYLEENQEKRMGGMLAPFIELEDSLDQKEFDDAQKIVRCADYLDAVLYLVVEETLGNNKVDYAIEGNMRGLEGIWRSLPADPDLLSKLWQTEILLAIDLHRHEGGRGIGGKPK